MLTELANVTLWKAALIAKHKKSSSFRFTKTGWSCHWFSCLGWSYSRKPCSKLHFSVLFEVLKLLQTSVCVLPWDQTQFWSKRFLGTSKCELLLPVLVALLLTLTNAVLQPGGSAVERQHLGPAWIRAFNRSLTLPIQENKTICPNSVLLCSPVVLQKQWYSTRQLFNLNVFRCIEFQRIKDILITL